MVISESVILDLVKFVMCPLVSWVHMTFYILTKGKESLEPRVHMTNFTRSVIFQCPTEKWCHFGVGIITGVLQCVIEPG